MAPPPARVAETDEFGHISDIRHDGSWLRVERYDMRKVQGGYETRFRAEFWTAYTVDPDVAIWGSVQLRGERDLGRVDLARLITFIDSDLSSRETLFHVDVENGRVIGIEEQPQD
ncbi:MAG: hypothetical protein QOE84_2639 [Actinomycetota bacterium]|jgi:hypothetical protein|nr:hypothetical protein [Actinomycetota bacterium]